MFKFKQSDWMKIYIDFNTHTHKKKLLLIVLKKNFPTFISRKIFDKNYAAVHEIKPVLTLNKPIYVGFIALELSIWLMYDFHYNFIKNILMLNCCSLTQTALLKE